MQHVLAQILVVLAASLVAVYGLGRLKLPSIVGYLIAGIAIGPKGFGLVHDAELIEHMAEIGIVLLMFTIGLKFSVAEITRMKGLVFGAGSLQFLFTTLACVGLAVGLGHGMSQGLFIGFLVAMSSTAIVLKLFEESGQMESPHGRLSTGILVFQDLMVVPCTLLTPMLAGTGGSAGEATGKLLLSLGVVAVLLFGSRIVLPRLFSLVAATRSREVFVLATILVILATAAAAGAAGLSLALGALIAGVVLSESDYANQVLSDVVPLRDLLASLFFVSVGMLVDVREWAAAPLTTLGLTLAIFAVKGVVIWGIARGFRLRARAGILAGLALGQVGEFSFVLAREGKVLGLLDDATYRTFLSASVLTMALTPFAILLGMKIAKGGAKSEGGGEPGHDGGHGEDGGHGHVVRSGHVLVVGYGLVGRNVAKVLADMKIPVTVLELNLRSVRTIRAEGGDALFGDAGREEVLAAAGIAGARAIVLTAVDPVATRQAVLAAHRMNPRVEILVRTRFLSELDELRRLGATAVVPEEFETSIALAATTMERCGAAPDAITRFERALRGSGSYRLLREDDATTEEARAATLAGVLRAATFAEVTVPPGAAGKTLRSLDLRARTGALVVAIRRGDDVTGNPGADQALAAGDVLLLVATTAQADAVRAALA